MGGSECAMISEWIICVRWRDHMMGTMGGMNYEFVMLHQQMAKNNSKSFLPHLLLFSNYLPSSPSIRHKDSTSGALLSFSFCGG